MDASVWVLVETRIIPFLFSLLMQVKKHKHHQHDSIYSKEDDTRDTQDAQRRRHLKGRPQQTCCTFKGRQGYSKVLFPHFWKVIYKDYLIEIYNNILI